MDDHSTTETSGKSKSEQDLVQLRYERIDAFLRESLEDSDGLQANLGAAASGLMRMAARFEHTIEEALLNDDASLGNFRKLVAPMEFYLKLTRQYDRLIGLKARTNATRKGSPS